MNVPLVIVTGSSGFIGSRLCEYLLSNKMVVLGVDIDNSKMVHKNYNHLKLDVSEYDNMIQLEHKMINIKNMHGIASDDVCVCHLAAKINVKESMSHLHNYYKNNAISTLNIMDFMCRNKLNKIYFSSTAAVYNSSHTHNDKTDNKLIEGDTLEPESVYGNTKKIAEDIILDYSKQLGISGYIFRFFNVAGGKDTLYPPHHLIPILIDSYQKSEPWKVYGNDYDTEDGSCIRDYIHVNDIANAFYLAIKTRNYTVDIINLGSGCGHSVYEIMDITSNILTINNDDNNKNNKNINIVEYNRRPGDPPFLVADTNKAKKILDWSPEYLIIDIIKDTISSYE